METLEQKNIKRKQLGVKKSKRFREQIYIDEKRHEVFKKQDAERKNNII